MTASNETSARYRTCARECRLMAEEAREPDWRQTLLDLAQDLEEEADKIEVEGND